MLSLLLRSAWSTKLSRVFSVYLLPVESALYLASLSYASSRLISLSFSCTL